MDTERGHRDRMGNSHSTSERDYVRPDSHACEALPVPRREERQNMGTQPRKPKRRRPPAAEPASPPKPMWPVYLMLVGAVLYLCMPLDVIPDPLLGPGQVDDFFLFFLTYRKWKERKQHNSAQPQFRQDWAQPMWQDEYERPRQAVQQQPYAMAVALPPPEKPGFFARVLKAVSLIFGGEQ